MKKRMTAPILGVLTMLILLEAASPVAGASAGSVGLFDDFARFLCSPYISGLLVAIGLSCVILELMTTGFGAFGVIALCSFFLYFSAHLACDRFSWIALLLFGLGMLFLMLEAFVPTGFGVSGVLGILAVFGSMILFSSSVTAGLLSVLITAVMMILILVVSFRFMKKRNLIQKFILKDRTDTESGYISPNMDNEIYLGREGYTLTPLRPAGSMKIDEDRVDVVSEGDFVDVGVKVRVVGVDGTRVIVRVV